MKATRARSIAYLGLTAFWPRITHDMQQLIEKCMIYQEYGESQPLIGAPQELPPFPWHTIATYLLLEKNGLSDGCICILKVHHSEKLPNSTSTAVCIELSMIVIELGLPHIIRSDNGPCYISKEFQEFLQHYSIKQQTSSPNHPRSNRFVEHMVGVAKKLMHKAGSERKP